MPKRYAYVFRWPGHPDQRIEADSAAEARTHHRRLHRGRHDRDPLGRIVDRCPICPDCSDGPCTCDARAAGWHGRSCTCAECRWS